MLTALDLFSGLGGWSTAAVRLGVNIKYALNHDEDAAYHHKIMHPETAHYCQDAGDFPWDKLGRLDMILASPSCRDFTPAGKPARVGRGGNGSIDLERLAIMRKAERNTAWSVVAAATAIRPRVVLVENVKEMYHWRGYEAWELAMSGLGYRTVSHVLNAADYGGAVDRPRAFITCSLGEPIELTEEWGRGRDEGSVMYDHLDHDEFYGNLWKPIDSKPERTRSLIRTKQRESGLRRGILNNVGDGVRMRRVAELSPSLTREAGTQLMLVDHDRVRILNPGELARFMGWRDSELSLPTTRKAASKLIGNAISVDVAQGVIEQALGEFE